MMEVATTILVVLTSVAIAGLLWLKWRYNYWKRRNVVFEKPKFPLGNMQGVGKKSHVSILMRDLHRKYKGKVKSKFVGIFLIHQPVALILDLDLIKSILVKDFNHFQHRGVYHNEKSDPLGAHLFSIEGDKWKFLRAKLTPTFTSGKMKMMFNTITDLGDKLVTQIKEEGTDIEIKDMYARFTTDIIGSCAFGIDCNSLQDKNAEFLKMGKKAFIPPGGNLVYRLLKMTFADLARFLGVRSLNEEVSKFFMRIVKETVNFRESNYFKRDDFLNSLLQLKSRSELTMDQVAAQVFLFQAAGFETSSTALTYTSYELALNPEIQEKARKEVKKVLAQFNGELSYEAMQSMTYLEQVINESLRMYPPGANIVRFISKDYPVEGTDVVFEKGKYIWISNLAIHYDPEIYPEPHTFNPDRFRTEEVSKRHPMAFLPFGEGPRNCIGLRFAMMEIKVALCKLLTNFEIEKTEKLQIPMQFSASNIVLAPKDDVVLRFKPIN